MAQYDLDNFELNYNPNDDWYLCYHNNITGTDEEYYLWSREGVEQDAQQYLNDIDDENAWIYKPGNLTYDDVATWVDDLICYTFLDELEDDIGLNKFTFDRESYNKAIEQFRSECAEVSYNELKSFLENK
jgi:hypothetical protein